MESVRLQWVVCRRETRMVEAARVECPLRGSIPPASCLACRFLMTSSDERGGAGWCELPLRASPRPAALRRDRQPPGLAAPAPAMPVEFPVRVAVPIISAHRGELVPAGGRR